MTGAHGVEANRRALINRSSRASPSPRHAPLRRYSANVNCAVLTLSVSFISRRVGSRVESHPQVGMVFAQMTYQRGVHAQAGYERRR